MAPRKWKPTEVKKKESQYTNITELQRRYPSLECIVLRISSGYNGSSDGDDTIYDSRKDQHIPKFLSCTQPYCDGGFVIDTLLENMLSQRTVNNTAHKMCQGKEHGRDCMKYQAIEVSIIYCENDPPKTRDIV